jgi:hypothetical protein
MEVRKPYTDMDPVRELSFMPRIIHRNSGKRLQIVMRRMGFGL